MVAHGALTSASLCQRLTKADLSISNPAVYVSPLSQTNTVLK